MHHTTHPLHDRIRPDVEDRVRAIEDVLFQTFQDLSNRVKLPCPFQPRISVIATFCHRAEPPSLVAAKYTHIAIVMYINIA